MKTVSILFGSLALIATGILLLARNAHEPAAANNIVLEIKPSGNEKSSLKAVDSFRGDAQDSSHEKNLGIIPGEQKQPVAKPEVGLEAGETEIVESAEELPGSLPQEAANQTMRPMDRFNSEPVDYYRAAGMEQSYIDLFGSNPLLADFALAEANCKSEYCRISVAVTDKDQTIRLANALYSSLLEKYGKIDLQIGSYNEKGLAKFYIRSVSADDSASGQKGL